MTDHSLLSFTPTKHSDTKTHKATEWQGKKTIQVNDHPLPLLTDPVSLHCRMLMKYAFRTPDLSLTDARRTMLFYE